MDYRQIVRMLAAGRVVVGTTLTVFPGFAGGMWIGEAAKDPGVKVMIRAMGIRDFALGAGMLQALSKGEPTKSWAGLCATADAVDALATVKGAPGIGFFKALPVVAVAATSAVLHGAAMSQLD